MKIAMVVHGRFHGFDLARALIARGHDVRIFTNYPKLGRLKFGLPAERVCSFWPHGVASRIVNRMGQRIGDLASPSLHRAFGKWALNKVRQEKWDAIHAFSGVAEEVFSGTPEVPRHVLVRGSSHIRYQLNILRDESARIGVRLETPGDWIVEREDREYGICDRICVLSLFAWRSFVETGVPAHKLALLPLGVDASAFRPRRDVLVERQRRIRSGEPLRVILAGTVCFRKGLYDFEKIARAVDPRANSVPVDWVHCRGGDEVHDDASGVALRRSTRQPQSKLPQWYAGGDLFMLPTLEDGFAVVLTQASAAGLPSPGDNKLRCAGLCSRRTERVGSSHTRPGLFH